MNYGYKAIMWHTHDYKPQHQQEKPDSGTLVQKQCCDRGITRDRVQGMMRNAVGHSCGASMMDFKVSESVSGNKKVVQWNLDARTKSFPRLCS